MISHLKQAPWENPHHIPHHLHILSHPKTDLNLSSHEASVISLCSGISWLHLQLRWTWALPSIKPTCSTKKLGTTVFHRNWGPWQQQRSKKGPVLQASCRGGGKFGDFCWPNIRQNVENVWKNHGFPREIWSAHGGVLIHSYDELCQFTLVSRCRMIQGGFDKKKWGIHKSPWLLKNTKMILFGLGNLHVNPPATWLYPVDVPNDLTIITFFVFLTTDDMTSRTINHENQMIHPFFIRTNMLI